MRVTFTGREVGAAVFTAAMWTMALSPESVDAAHPSPQDFATLVDNAVHETQHTVTTFRGVRVAIDRTKSDKNAYVPDSIVQEAEAANGVDRPLEGWTSTLRTRRSRSTSWPVASPARRSKDDSCPDSPPRGAGPPGSGSSRARGRPIGTAPRRWTRPRKPPHDANAQRKVQETATAYERAQQAYIPAHNAYMSLPEGDVLVAEWRPGEELRSSSRIALEEQLSAARTRALTLAADRRARQRAGADQRASPPPSGRAGGARHHPAASSAARATRPAGRPSWSAVDWIGATCP